MKVYISVTLDPAVVYMNPPCVESDIVHEILKLDPGFTVKIQLLKGEKSLGEVGKRLEVSL